MPEKSSRKVPIAVFALSKDSIAPTSPTSFATRGPAAAPSAFLRTISASVWWSSATNGTECGNWSTVPLPDSKLCSNRLCSKMALTIEIDHRRSRSEKVVPRTITSRVVPQSIEGRVRRLKWAVLVLALGVYYVAPFLQWDRGPGEPNQAIQLDFEHGRLYGSSSRS